MMNLKKMSVCVVPIAACAFIAVVAGMAVAEPTATDVASDAVVDLNVSAGTDDELNPDTLAADLLAAVRSGAWLPATGIVLVLLVWGLRAFGRRIFPWFGSKRGGYVMAFATATITVVGTAWAAGAGVSFGLLTNAIGAGFAAIGIHTSIKDASAKRPL